MCIASFRCFTSFPRRCNEKFAKLKVCNAAAFEKQQREAEERRQQKLKAVEDAMYGNVGKVQKHASSDRLRRIGQDRAEKAAAANAAPAADGNLTARSRASSAGSKAGAGKAPGPGPTATIDTTAAKFQKLVR